jgi:protein subunit release factor A
MTIELRSAEGGDDSKLFMVELAQTYTKYLSAKG